MNQAHELLPRKRGRPRSKGFDPILVTEINPDTASAEEWFSLCDQLWALKKKGHGREGIAAAIGKSPASISRLWKGARWPGKVRALILIHAEKFTPDVLMGLARQSFKDEGSQSQADGRRRVMKSRCTLLGAVQLIIEGKALPKPTEPARTRLKKMESLANQERSRRQTLQSQLESLSEDNARLRSELSLDRYSHALRENRALKLELQRLRVQPGATARPQRSPDQEYRDRQLASVLRCEVETIDWKRGLIMLNLRSGEILDGFYDDLISTRRI